MSLKSHNRITRAKSNSFYQLVILRVSILIVLVEISEEETKEHKLYISDKQLNLFKQTFLMIHYSLVPIRQVKLSNEIETSNSFFLSF